MPAPAWTALLAGLLPIAVVNAAYLWNIQHGMDVCFPYTDGCTSVSRAMRSGPGLVILRLLVVPIALCLALTWMRLPAALHGPWIRRLGLLGAAFMLVYAFTLGTDGDVYRWMRRYGVVMYFGCTGLAQLLLARVLWRDPGLRGSGSGIAYLGLVALMWLMGVVSAFKRQLFDDPAIQDRVQNALEWDFALAMSLVFVALAAVLRRARSNAAGRAH